MYQKYREYLSKPPYLLSVLDLLSVILIIYTLGLLFRLKDIPVGSWNIIVFFTVWSSLCFPIVLPGLIDTIKYDFKEIRSPATKCYEKCMGFLSILGLIIIMILTFLVFLLPLWLKVKYVLEIPFISQYFSDEAKHYFQSLKSFPWWSIIIMYFTFHFASLIKDNKRI